MLCIPLTGELDTQSSNKAPVSNSHIASGTLIPLTGIYAIREQIRYLLAIDVMR